MAEKLTVQVLNMEGKKLESLELDPTVFGIRPAKDIVHQAVRWQLAKRRAGTHSVKTRSFMKGGGKKPWKQKGTGRARAGSNNSPLWVGGAVVHGPSPRSYEFRFPKRMRRLALASVLSEKLAEGRILVFDQVQIESGKTKEMAEFLSRIGASDKRSLMISDAVSDETLRSTRNIKSLITQPVIGVNVYDLLKQKWLIVSKESLIALQERVQGTASQKQAA